MKEKISSKNKSQTREQLSLYKIGNDFDFKGSDTQYSTHALHTYVAAMVPQLAEKLVIGYVPKGESVLDPFCGGGAVLVECTRNRRKAIGSDINPLAVLISKVKSTYIDEKCIVEATNATLETAKRMLNGAIRFPDKYNVEYWFLPQTIAELSALVRTIRSFESQNKFSKDVIDVLKVIFSSTVRDVMLTYRNEVRLRRFEEKDLEKFNPDAFKSFSVRSRIAIQRIPKLPKTARSIVDRSSVKNLPYQDKTFHSIICSPPYGDERNGVSYLQFSKFMMYWLGHSREEVIKARGDTLGAKNNSYSLPSSTLQEAFRLIDQYDMKNNGINFYADYYSGLKEMIRVTRENVIIVIGNRILKQVLVENGKITIDFMESLGWKLAEHHARNLPSKRLPKLRRESSHGFGGAIDKEDILVFKESR